MNIFIKNRFTNRTQLEYCYYTIIEIYPFFKKKKKKKNKNKKKNKKKFFLKKKKKKVI